MNSIVFKPIVPLFIMIIYSIILLIIVILNKKNIVIRILLILLILLISQRPVIEDFNNKFYKDLDIMFVVDTTLSMNAIDVNGNSRMHAVKNDCKKIMQSFMGARFSVITFNNYSMVKLPFTDDSSVIYDVIDNLEVIDPNFARGSSLDLPYDNMKSLLDSSNNKDNRIRVVFFMSDGEVNLSDKSNKDLDKYSNIKDLINNGAVLGYGTSSGGKIKIMKALSKDNLVDSNNYLIDKMNNKSAISKINETSLLYLKDKLSLDYYNMKNFNILTKKINDIKKITKESTLDPLYYDKDLYYYVSPFLIIFIICDIYYIRRNDQ